MMRGAYPHLTVLLLLVQVLAACTVSRTSRVNEEPPGKTHAHVAVFLPTGQPAPMARLLAESLVTGLARRGYNVALADGEDVTGTFLIKGRAAALEAIHAPTVAALYWTLLDNTGREIAFLTQGVRGEEEDWTYGSPDLLRFVGEQAAANLSPLLGPNHMPDQRAEETILSVEELLSVAEPITVEKPAPEVTQQSEPEYVPPAQPAPVSEADTRIADLGVWIDEVTGAPGNGNRALTRALRRELEATGLPFAISVGAASHFVQGIVDVRVNDATSEHVSIVWIVLDSGGKELGRVSQDNMVRRGILHEDWGDTARYAAIGGADAVLSIIEQDIIAE